MMLAVGSWFWVLLVWVGWWFALLGLLDSVVLRVDYCDVGLLAIRLNCQFACLLIGLVWLVW